MPRSHVPVRRCVGCGQRAARTELVRFATVGGAVVPDPEGRLPGRGAWLHPTRPCWEDAVRRRAFARAFKAPAIVSADALDFTSEWPRSASTS